MAKTTEGARYRKVYSQFWRDRDVLKLTESERLIALYCMTGPQSNRIGLFAFSIALAAEDFGNPPRTFAERLANVCRTLNWGYDEHARVLYIPSWWRWNPPQNVNVMDGNLKDLVDLPETYLLHEFIDNTANLPRTYAERLANVCETFAERSPIQEQDKKQDKEQEQEQKQKQDVATSLAASERFDRFWSVYPERNSKKLGKQTARGKFLNLEEADQELAILAAANYARSSAALDNVARDPARFLEADYWRDYQTPESIPASSSRRVRQASNAIDEVMGVLTGDQHGTE